VAGKGATEIDFGAFPGKSDASILVPETGVSSHPTSIAEAWLVPVATADHTDDEHLVESIAVRAGPCVAGVGFTVYGWNTSQLNEPLVPGGAGRAASATFGAQASDGMPRIGGMGTRIYGKWTVAWAWS
jgi:hypothetical protein